MSEKDTRRDTAPLHERQRRFEEDLVDAYDEELEMELTIAASTTSRSFPPSAAKRASATSASCFACRANS